MCETLACALQSVAIRRLAGDSDACSLYTASAAAAEAGVPAAPAGSAHDVLRLHETELDEALLTSITQPVSHCLQQKQQQQQQDRHPPLSSAEGEINARRHIVAAALAGSLSSVPRCHPHAKLSTSAWEVFALVGESVIGAFAEMGAASESVLASAHSPALALPLSEALRALRAWLVPAGAVALLDTPRARSIAPRTFGALCSCLEAQLAALGDALGARVKRVVPETHGLKRLLRAGDATVVVELVGALGPKRCPRALSGLVACLELKGLAYQRVVSSVYSALATWVSTHPLELHWGANQVTMDQLRDIIGRSLVEAQPRARDGAAALLLSLTAAARDQRHQQQVDQTRCRGCSYDALLAILMHCLPRHVLTELSSESSTLRAVSVRAPTQTGKGACWYVFGRFVLILVAISCVC